MECHMLAGKRLSQTRGLSCSSPGSFHGINRPDHASSPALPPSPTTIVIAR